MPESLYTGCEEFVIRLYSSKSTTINEARYQLFCTESHQSQQLPPTQHALKKHIIRANYQTSLWKQAIDSVSDIPSLTQHGWILSDNSLDICWTDRERALDALLQLGRCKCNQICTTRCSCKVAELSCTDACECSKDCVNRAVFQSVSSDSDDDDDYNNV